MLVFVARQRAALGEGFVAFIAWKIALHFIGTAATVASVSATFVLAASEASEVTVVTVTS